MQPGLSWSAFPNSPPKGTCKPCLAEGSKLSFHLILHQNLGEMRLGKPAVLFIRLRRRSVKEELRSRAARPTLPKGPQQHCCLQTHTDHGGSSPPQKQSASHHSCQHIFTPGHLNQAETLQAKKCTQQSTSSLCEGSGLNGLKMFFPLKKKWKCNKCSEFLQSSTPSLGLSKHTAKTIRHRAKESSYQANCSANPTSLSRLNVFNNSTSTQ